MDDDEDDDSDADAELMILLNSILWSLKPIKGRKSNMLL